MEPHERIRYTFHKLQRTLLIAVGHDFFGKGGFKTNLLSFFMYFLNTLGITSCIYTLLWYDLATGLNSIGYGAVNIQLAAKIVLLYRYEHIIIRSIDRIIYVYEINAKTKSRKRALLMQKVSMFGDFFFIGGTIAYIFCGFLHFFNPIYGYFWEHEFKPLFPLYIPYIDENTVNGFAILLSIQTVEVFFAALASASVDFPYMIAVINVWIFSSIFEENVNELNDILREKNVNAALAKAKLRNIFKMYYDMWVVIDDMNTAFFLSNFVIIFAAAIASAMEFFICMKLGSIPAMFFAGVFLGQIFGYCAIGTIIELCNDQMNESLIHCDWYLLPIAEQMEFKFMITHVNMDKTLTLGGIRPLNLDTCVSILNKIYSFVMILHETIV